VKIKYKLLYNSIEYAKFQFRLTVKEIIRKNFGLGYKININLGDNETIEQNL